MKICPICGKENNDENIICPCGFNFQGTNFIPGKSENETKNLVRKKPKKNRRKLIIAACVLTFAIVVCGIAYGVHYMNTIRWHEKIDVVTFVSDGKIMLSDLSKPSANPLYLAELKGSEDNFSDYNGSFISKDGKEMVFCNNFREIDSFLTVSYDLYYCNLTEPSSPPLIIAEGITNHYVNEGFDTVTYETAGENKTTLFQSDFNKNRELIKEGFASYSLSKDGKRIVYSDDKEGSLYLKEKGKEAVLLGENAALVGANDSFSEIFLKSSKGKLIKTDGEKKESASELPKEKERESKEKSYAVDSLIKNTDKKNHLTLLVEDKSIEVNLPKGIAAENLTLTLTEKGNIIFLDSQNSTAYTYKNEKLVLCCDKVSFISLPFPPEKVINQKVIDFSQLT